MPDEGTARIDSIWQELTTTREAEIATARAAFLEAQAGIERAFAYRLSERLVADIIARRDTASAAPSSEAP